MTYCAASSPTPRVAQSLPWTIGWLYCVAATKWVHRQASAFGLDASRMAVGRRQRRRQFAAVVSIMARDEGGPPIRFQLLIYPGTEIRSTAASHRTNGQGYLLTSESIDYFHNHYSADPVAL